MAKRASNPNHTEALELIPDQGHIAYLSTQKTERIIIFIHGFSGSASTTWLNFPGILCNDALFDATDLIFYDYQSLKYSASDHAGDFYDFLKDHILTDSSTAYLVRAIRRRGLTIRDYKQIIFVAHSLGAIVLREAMLTANDQQMQWLDKTKMILFAPAHLGAHIKPLLFELMDLTLLTKLIGAYVRFQVPVLHDLEEDSIIINKIFSESKQLQEKGLGNFTKAAKVIHAKGDKVVNNNRFLQDKPAFRIEKTSHKKVCKPIDWYMHPVDQLIKELS